MPTLSSDGQLAHGEGNLHDHAQRTCAARRAGGPDSDADTHRASDDHAGDHSAAHRTRHDDRHLGHRGDDRHHDHHDHRPRTRRARRRPQAADLLIYVVNHWDELPHYWEPRGSSTTKAIRTPAQGHELILHVHPGTGQYDEPFGFGSAYVRDSDDNDCNIDAVVSFTARGWLAATISVTFPTQIQAAYAHRDDSSRAMRSTDWNAGKDGKDGKDGKRKS